MHTHTHTSTESVEPSDYERSRDILPSRKRNENFKIQGILKLTECESEINYGQIKQRNWK